MEPIEGKILEALIELDSTVKKMAAANPKPNLQALFSRLDELGRELPAGANPDLKHYLQRKSYEKALRLLMAERG
jgi:hypothetical protein